MQILTYLLIALGSVLMVFNIAGYFGFVRRTHWMSENTRDRLSLYLPLLLLVLFLIGYVSIGIFLAPNLLVASILFGGSLFVMIVLGRLYFIIERVRANERRAVEAEEANRAKTVFLSNMSHDLRTPMNAILGYTQLACREDCGEAELRGYMSKIRASGDHLLTLINDVLEMSRIESGRMELRPEETDLHRMMEELHDLFAAQMGEKGIRFSVQTQELADRIVLCDRDRLNRVLLNLVSNALKFTPADGSVAVTLRETGTDGDLGRYVFSVRDTGIGMSQEFAERVFDAFERERSSTVSGIQGTGLGMAITKKLVELMGGSITLETEQGKGTVFTVTLDLPILPNPGEGNNSGCGCAGQMAEVFAGKHLLLTEDNEINLEIATMLLTQLGFTVDTARNGQEALERIREKPAGTYDAVLMDMQMPVMDGYEATKRIRSLEDPERAKVPVVAITANAFSEDIDREREAGMSGHISKPLSLPEMTRTLCEILGGR